MKGISLWQPWASLIAAEVKTIETRSWPSPAAVLGCRIAIHAAKTRQGLAVVAGLPAGCEMLTALALEFPEGPESLPFGALVATAVVEASVPTSRLTPDAFGDFSVGRYGWILSGIVALPEPVPFRGRQGFFEVPDALLTTKEASNG